MKIDILMATYNGDKYIESQLLSLIAQTHKDWQLLIHDDGSDDDTVKIIEHYALIESRIKLIKDGLVFSSASKNFLHLLPFATSELIIFCDQDDIWLENKIELLYLTYLESNKTEKPLAVFANGYTYDTTIGIIGNRMVEVNPKNLKEQLFLNTGIHGCCLMFNRLLLKELLPVPKYVAMHDHLITLGAITFGELLYLDKPLMLYRQNHINKATLNIEHNKIKRFLSVFNRKIGVVEKRHFLGSKSFYDTYKSKITPENIVLFDSYFLFCDTENIFTRIFIIINHQFQIYGSVWKLIIKTILRKRIL